MKKIAIIINSIYLLAMLAGVVVVISDFSGTIQPLFQLLVLAFLMVAPILFLIGRKSFRCVLASSAFYLLYGIVSAITLNPASTVLEQPALWGMVAIAVFDVIAYQINPKNPQFKGTASVGRFGNKSGSCRATATRAASRRQVKKPGNAVEQLMARDGISRREAERRVEHTRSLIDAAMDDGCMEEIEDIVAEELGDGIAYEDEFL